MKSFPFGPLYLKLWTTIGVYMSSNGKFVMEGLSCAAIFI